MNEVKVGLHQGSVLSPLLFAAVMDVVSSDARSGLPSELLYADDLVIMAPTMEQLGRRVADWRASLLAKGLKVNAGKFKSRAPPLEMKGRVYAICVRSSMTYGSETRPLLADVGLKFERAEMQMIRWMCGISLKDRKTNEELKRLVGVEPITTLIRSGRLRWHGHVMRKGDEDWVKKCMEYGVEGRRPVGRLRKTWVESVEADMAELEIDKEDVHDRSKWRRNVNVMKRKSNPIGKRTINQ